MSFDQIIPECYADTLLVMILGFKEPNHKLGIGSVIMAHKNDMRKRKAVGIIDNDKRKPEEILEFEQVARIQGVIKLLKGNHTILMVHPAFEAWVFENAAEVGTDPSKFGFKNQKDFQNACKRQDVRDNNKVKNFLNTLHQKKAPGFVQLKTWICEAAGIDEQDLD